MSDEEIIKTLKFAIAQDEVECIGYWDEKYRWVECSMKDVFDVIQRLQGENKGLKERGEKIINGLYETIDKKQAEIERLTEERDMYADDLYWKAEVRKREDFITELTVENAELQKQVDEWNSAFIPTRARQQAVKDTAKEILQEGKYCLSKSLRDWIRERYGVEVE